MPNYQIKIAILTPTYNRDSFLLQTLSYIEQQKHTAVAIRWFVLDDSPQISAHEDYFKSKPFVQYEWKSEKIPLGKKRNRLNQLARAWGANIICSMDDDDWYGETYIQDMSEILMSHIDHEFVGSSEDYYYDVEKDRIIRIPQLTPTGSCNGVLCYKARVLKNHQYNASATFAEESQFLNKARVIQHPNVQKIHLALAHPNNTVSKKNFLADQYVTTLTLDDFPMLEADKAFFRNLHAQTKNE